MQLPLHRAWLDGRWGCSPGSGFSAVRWPLRYQLLVPFGAVTALALVALSALQAHLAALRTERQIEAQLDGIAETLRLASFPLTDAVLRQMRGLSGAEFLVADAARRVIAASDPAFADSVLEDTGAGEIRLRSAQEVGGASYFHASVPMRSNDGRTPGSLLHVFYPEQNWREARWQAAMPSCIVGGVALGLVFATGAVVARRVTRPIQQLQAQAARMAEGCFEPIELPARHDELRDLVASVNSLARQMNSMIAAIKRTERYALLGQLSGGLAHHLRNTITGARLGVQLHQRRCPDADPEALAVAMRQLSLAEEQLQRFLAVGQPAPPRCVEFDFNTVLGELVSLIEPSCRHRQVELRVLVENDSLPMSADPDQLKQLSLNLALNAIEAAASGGWVEIATCLLPGDNLSVRVRDSGQGPPAELEDRMFEPFVTGKPDGIGLGLAVARQLAEANGGRLTFSRADATCFELILPAAPRPLQGERQASLACAGASPEAD